MLKVSPPGNTIVLISGSHRSDGNTQGIVSWIIRRFEDHTASSSHTLARAEDLITHVPTQAVEQIAAMIRDPEGYASAEVRQWSRLISAAPAVAIVTPQYNWGYPGPLKNSLDHIYHEWRGKPVALITCGGHGGGKCGEALKVVLDGGLKMDVRGQMQVIIPETFIRGTDRVPREGKVFPQFLEVYEKELDELFTSLSEAIQKTE